MKVCNWNILPILKCLQTQIYLPYCFLKKEFFHRITSKNPEESKIFHKKMSHESWITFNLWNFSQISATAKHISFPKYLVFPKKLSVFDSPTQNFSYFPVIVIRRFIEEILISDFDIIKIMYKKLVAIYRLGKLYWRRKGSRR